MSGIMPWDGVLSLIQSGVERIWPDKNKQMEVQADLIKAHEAGMLKDMEDQWANATQQIEVNKIEAASSSLFIAGWRPFIGWVCGSAFAYSYILQPFLVFFVRAFGSVAAVKDIAGLPTLDIAGMMPVLLGMLGLGTMRTFEKVKGVISGH